jgi:hypothetical protein
VSVGLASRLLWSSAVTVSVAGAMTNGVVVFVSVNSGSKSTAGKKKECVYLTKLCLANVSIQQKNGFEKSIQYGIIED